MYMQITITTANLAVMGIRRGLTPHDIYLWMLGQSHCKLFSEASRSQRWVTELQFTDQHLRLSPLAQLDTHTHPCVNLSETNGVRWGECAALAVATSACTRGVYVSSSWMHRPSSEIPNTLTFIYLPRYYCTDACFLVWRHWRWLLLM